MSYYLYAKPDGSPDVSDHRLNLDLFPGYHLAGEFVCRPDISGKKFHSGEWVDQKTNVAQARRKAYPSLGDQLDMLWHAMDSGAIPKADAFYAAIKAVKDAHPKEAT